MGSNKEVLGFGEFGRWGTTCISGVKKGRPRIGEGNGTVKGDKGLWWF